MKLKKLDPNIPHQKAMIEIMHQAKVVEWRNPETFYKKVQSIMREWKEGACRKAGIPIDTKLDHNLIVATTEDDIVFFSRADLIIYPGLKLYQYIEMDL